MKRLFYGLIFALVFTANSFGADIRYEEGLRDLTPKFVLKWGTYGSCDGCFRYPLCVAVDKKGYVYVVDNNNFRIQKFKKDGAFVSKWGTNSYPWGIAVDSQYNYSTDQNYSVSKFTNDGSFVKSWGSKGSGNGQFNWPTGVAVDGTNNVVYIGDTSNNCIQKFTSDGQFLLKWGSYGNGDGQFNAPRGLAVDGEGYVYVADDGNSRIQKFASDGKFVTKLAACGNGKYGGVNGVSVDSSGNIYYSCWNGHSIEILDKDGSLITNFGGYGSGDGQFNRPIGVAVDDDGSIYIGDFMNNRVQKFIQPDVCKPVSMSVFPPRLTLIKGDSGIVIVTVTGENDCLIEGETVTAIIKKGSKKGITVSPTSRKTDTNGQAMFTITSGNKTGNARVAFEAGDLKKLITVRVD